VQHACDQYTKLLTEAALRSSMSRRGNPCDNTQAESFFKTLKHEEVNLTQYRNSQEVTASIPSFHPRSGNVRPTQSRLWLPTCLRIAEDVHIRISSIIEVIDVAEQQPCLVSQSL
jgi:transposase InsO family protein